MSAPTIEEQIEAVKRAHPQRLYPSDRPALRAAVETLRRVQRGELVPKPSQSKWHDVEGYYQDEPLP